VGAFPAAGFLGGGGALDALLMAATPEAVRRSTTRLTETLDGAVFEGATAFLGAAAFRGPAAFLVTAGFPDAASALTAFADLRTAAIFGAVFLFPLGADDGIVTAGLIGFFK